MNEYKITLPGAPIDPEDIEEGVKIATLRAGQMVEFGIDWPDIVDGSRVPSSELRSYEITIREVS